jgi:hypothetical protein
MSVLSKHLRGFSEENEKNGETLCPYYAIVVQRDPEERMEFEEIASVAMAVRCGSLVQHRAGLLWSTPKAALEAGEFFSCSPAERCPACFTSAGTDTGFAG